MKVHRGILFIFLLLVAGSIYFIKSALDNSKRAETMLRWVKHTHDVINQLDHLETTITSLESGTRAYVITGNSVFLKEAALQRNEAIKAIAIIERLTADNKKQQENVAILYKLVQQKVQFQDEIMAANKLSNKNALELIATLKGKNISSNLNGLAQLMEEEEKRLLNIRTAEISAISKEKLHSATILSSIAIVFFAIALYQVSKENALRRKAEATAKANEKKYEALVDNSTVVIYTSDLQERIIYMSKKGEELFGYSQAELSGTSLLNLVHPDWHDEVSQLFRTQVANRIPETFAIFPILTKTGELRWLERTTVLLMEQDEPLYTQSIAKDITEKKKIEERLQLAEKQIKIEQEESQIRLQAILNNVPLGMYIKDLEGRFMMINKTYEQLVNEKEENLIGKTVYEISKNREAADRYMQAVEKVKATLTSVELEDVLTTTGTQRHILIIKFPLFNSENKLFGIGGVCKDITEDVQHKEVLVSARLKAEQAEQLQEEFLANMSHEIRTPMNGITGMTNLLQDTKLTGTQEEYVQVIKHSADSLLVLINDILDLSKIKAGRMFIEEINFNLDDVIDQVLYPQLIKTNVKGVQLKKKIEANVPLSLKGDAHKLAQILNNLVGNAVKFTNKGKISVTVMLKHDAGDFVTLAFTVADTGMGIAAENIATIFDSFAQATSDVTRKFGGTGLGLSITKRLIELQNGKIEVNSEEGQGTRFYFELSYARSAEKDQKTESLKLSVAEGNGNTSFEGNKVLLVEDNLVNQKVAFYTLKKMNVEIDIANNAREAVELMERGASYDLIIMDLQMPVMDGFQGTAYIRNKLKLDTPIIMMTASVLRDEKIKCLKLGVNEFLPKPFAPSDLLTHVRHYLNLGTAEDANDLIEMAENNGLYNLAYLHEMEDEHYLIEVLELFLQNTPVLLAELKEHTLHERWDEVRSKAHKIKSGLGLLQMKEILENVTSIEDMTKEEKNLEEIPALIKAVSDQFSLIRPMIETDLRKAKRVSA